ncbi:MAG: hypothetical protein J4432_00725 [DPANN group archaeon]|nr:hypothetical protein [DPANN group archaeon]
MVKALEKVLTGIEGLDEMLNGGLPRKHNVLVMGGPGSGKTMFGMQYLYNGFIKHGQKGAYLSLEETPERLIQDTGQAFGWNLKELVENQDLFILKMEKFNFQNLMDMMQSTILQQNVKRIVIDPLSLMHMCFKNETEFRVGLFNMLEFLGQQDVTTLLIAERSFSERGGIEFGLEEFITDGVIVLYNFTRKNERIRALEILKMRGTDHSKNIYPFHITPEGIVLLQEELL